MNPFFNTLMDELNRVSMKLDAVQHDLDSLSRKADALLNDLANVKTNCEDIQSSQLLSRFAFFKRIKFTYAEKFIIGGWLLCVAYAIFYLGKYILSYFL
jgi:hypothetical protein